MARRRAAGVSDRCTVVSLFVESVPSGGDAYVVKHIVHDWEDDEVLQILCNVRTAITADAKLLIIEAETPDDDREHVSKLLDLEMLVAGRGKDRMEAQYAELLHRATSASHAPFDGGAHLGRRARSGLTELIPRRYAVGLDDPRRI
ncbi:MAG TPA: methyltransferase [Mycobacterium sp.]